MTEDRACQSRARISGGFARFCGSQRPRDTRPTSGSPWLTADPRRNPAATGRTARRSSAHSASPLGCDINSFEVSFEAAGWAASADQHILQTIHWVPSVPPEWNVLFRDIWTKGKKTKSKIKSSPESELKSTYRENNNTHSAPNESSETT